MSSRKTHSIMWAPALHSIRIRQVIRGPVKHPPHCPIVPLGKSRDLEKGLPPSSSKRQPWMPFLSVFVVFLYEHRLSHKHRLLFLHYWIWTFKDMNAKSGFIFPTPFPDPCWETSLEKPLILPSEMSSRLQRSPCPFPKPCMHSHKPFSFSSGAFITKAAWIVLL